MKKPTLSSLLVLALFCWVSPLFAQDEQQGEESTDFNYIDPVGEIASYRVVSGSRTTRLIRSGEADVEIMQASARYRRDYYAVEVKASLSVRFSGNQQKTTYFLLPKTFYDEDFMSTIANRPYSSPFLKIKYLRSVRANGQACHKIFVYDIKELRAPFVEATDPIVTDIEVKDMKFEAVICPNVPALGAFTLDVQATAAGQTGKAGLNFVR